MNQVEVKRRQIELFSYMIGIVTIWLLGRQIGDGGVAYLAVAMECFSFLWILLGNNIVGALGRMLRSKNAKGQYKNAVQIKRNILIFQSILGAVGSLVFFFCARPLAEVVFRIPRCTLIFQLMAPVIFLRCISGVLLGYFRGAGTQLAEVVSCILRQVFVLGFSLLFCGLRKGYGIKVSKLLLQEQLTAVYSGSGVAIALSLSELLIILFLLVLYQGSRKSRQRQNIEGSKVMDSFGRTIYSLYSHMGMEMVIQLLCVFPLLAGVLFYQRSVTDTIQSTEVYGSFFGKYLLLSIMAALPLGALILPIAAKTAGCVRKEEQRFAKGIFQTGVHIGVVNALLSVAFAACLSEQFAGLFGGTLAAQVARMLRRGSFLILFMVLSFYFSNLLILLGRRYVVVGALGLYNVLFIVLVTLFLYTGKMDIMALIYGGLIACLIYSLVTGFFVSRQLRCGLQMLMVLGVPVAAACLVGLLVFLLGRALTPHLGNGVTIILCVILGTALYWIILLLLRNFKEQELSTIPGGRLIRIVGEMLRIYY